jgi:hypothetical protein
MLLAAELYCGVPKKSRVKPPGAATEICSRP